MPPIVSFIGWHNSGKTTLASQVVTHLQDRGYSVAVIKSTKESGISHGPRGTDTKIYRRAGATGVMLAAPDQMILETDAQGKNLIALAHRYFPDVHLVLAEGFKNARQVAKIEVSRGDGPLLRDQVSGVIAIATDQRIAGDYIFRLDESREIADFIEKRFLKDEKNVRERVVLMIDGRKIVLKDFVQEILANTVTGFVDSLKAARGADNMELRIRLLKDGSDCIAFAAPDEDIKGI